LLRVDAAGSTSIPQNIFESNLQFGCDGRGIDSGAIVEMFAIRAILRKPGSAEFATPVDLPAELMTSKSTHT
jgi:hypothetical protein